MNKLRTLPELTAECDAWRAQGKRIVWTNGCFDLFHAGHARALAAARSLGDILVMGVNSDRSVRELKGEGRPICGEADRAAMLSALESVDRIVVFDGKRCDREIAAVRPHVWTKSGDYTADSLDPAERAAVLAGGGRIEITPLIPGISTTLIVDRIRRFDPEKIVSAACAYIRDDNGRLLMVATRYADAVKWSLPGGGHRHGESLEAAAKREAEEETGLGVAVVRHMGMVERIEPTWGLHLVMGIFETRLCDPADYVRTAFSPDPVEHKVVDVAWFDRDRLANEPAIVLGRRLWLEYGDRAEAWPTYILMRRGEE